MINIEILRVLFYGIVIIMEILGLRREKPEAVRQNLIQQQNKRSHQIFKNRLLLTSILNLLVFLIFVFAMSYYKWSVISIPIYFVDQAAQKVNKGEFDFYVNLLYAKQIDQPHYQSFPSLADEICVQNDIYCESAFIQLAFVGYLSFGILLLGASFQVWDIYKMMLYFIGREKQADFREEKQDNLRHILTIGHFLIGISLNIYGLAEMEVQVQLGASFWTFVGGLIAFIIIIIYEQIALTHIRRQKLILKLMQGEREITNQISASMELSSEGDFYI